MSLLQAAGTERVTGRRIQQHEIGVISYRNRAFSVDTESLGRIGRQQRRDSLERQPATIEASFEQDRQS
jgi:hypothetical protein